MLPNKSIPCLPVYNKCFVTTCYNSAIDVYIPVLKRCANALYFAFQDKLYWGKYSPRFIFGWQFHIYTIVLQVLGYIVGVRIKVRSNGCGSES